MIDRQLPVRVRLAATVIFIFRAAWAILRLATGFWRPDLRWGDTIVLQYECTTRLDASAAKARWEA